MKLTAGEFRAWDHKRITLLGMSGVGKTRLATLLRHHDWFHYSVHYRIGTRYLDEPILDNIKQQAMKVPFLRDLLRSDSIYVRNNITVDNLQPVSSFLGKPGNPALGGLSLAEFKRRQILYRDAEIAATRDIPAFVRKAREIYGYRHFVSDTSGSLCEFEEPGLIELLARHTMVVYVKASGSDEEALRRHAQDTPRPIFYREDFLDAQLGEYMGERGLQYVALVDPDDFAGWVFPRLLRARLPRYERPASEHGYTVTTEELAGIATEAEFLGLLEEVVSRGA